MPFSHVSRLKYKYLEKSAALGETVWTNAAFVLRINDLMLV